VVPNQYAPTRFPAHHKLRVDKRLLTCSHAMMSNEHEKHSLNWSLESLAPWPQNLHHWFERQNVHSQYWPLAVSLHVVRLCHCRAAIPPQERWQPLPWWFSCTSQL